MIIRVWAEYLTPEDFLDKKTMELLKKYDVKLGIAFPPGSMTPEYVRVLGEYGRNGVSVALWPLLDDSLGYWPNELNVIEYSDYVDGICAWADENKVGFDWLAIDMEPPYLMMEDFKTGGLKEKLGVVRRVLGENRDRGRFYDAGAAFNRLVERLHARGVKVAAAAADMAVWDMKMGTVGFQDALETPISTINFDLISPMVYTSMIVGYSKGLVSPGDARRHLYSVARDLKESVWNRAGICIGVTWTGKLMDEPYYETPRDLLPDMQAVKAALIDDISIYNLEGILRSPRPEEWFETLIAAEPKTPERSLKVDIAHGLGRIAAKLL